MIELLIFALLGIALGIFTGLIPGLHVNTMALIMLGFAGMFQPLPIAVAVIAMAISATFFDFIPSTLLGAPDAETALSVLPGHRLLMQGRGLEAIYLTMLGGLCATILAALSFPLIILAIPALYVMVQGYIVWILVAMAAFSVLSEKGMGTRLWALLILILSGLLGYLALNNIMFSDPLFPMFTGLFGTGSILFSLNMRASKIPTQQQKPKQPSGRLLISGVLKGLVSGSLVGTLPAMGSSQAAMLAQQATRKNDDQEYLISIGAINTIVALFSLVSLYTISKARSGAAVVVGRLLPDFGFSDLMVMLAVTLLAAGVSAFLVMRTASWTVGKLSSVSYPAINKAILAFLVILVFVFAGIPGLLLLGVATCIGLLAPLAGVRRSTSMGCLMIPLIIFYLGV